MKGRWRCSESEEDGARKTEWGRWREKDGRWGRRSEEDEVRKMKWGRWSEEDGRWGRRVRKMKWSEEEEVRKTERGRWETREMRKISGKKGRTPHGKDQHWSRVKIACHSCCCCCCWWKLSIMAGNHYGIPSPWPSCFIPEAEAKSGGPCINHYEPWRITLSMLFGWECFIPW
jgi:hypothetical protein